MNEGSKRAIFAAFAANLGIAIAKFVGFLLTGSAGLMAEAVHSLADTGNQALLLLGSNRARQRPDDEHPFGFGRERYFWAFAVALVLFSMGGLFALYEGINKFRNPHEVESFGIAIVILLLASALDGYSLWTAIQESRKIKPPDMGWFRYIRESKQPELTVVLLEDSGAEIGLSFALAGVLLTHFTGDPRWDAAGSIAIGLLLIVIALLLANEMKSLLIGESASRDDVAKIRSAIEGSKDVDELLHLRTEHLGPDDIMIAAKIEYDSRLTFDEVTRAINTTEANIRRVVPAARIIYIEPDVHRTPEELAAEHRSDANRSAI